MFQSIDAPVPCHPLTWRKASYSTGNGSNCVELAALPEGVAVRDSKHPEGDILTFAPGALARLAASIKHGDL
jgi:hypothetical protein